MLASLNSMALDEIVGKQLFAVNARPGKQNSLKQRVFAMLGWLDGLDQALASQCLETIETEGIEAVYIEGSNYGRLAKMIKLAMPSCKIVTFFHNVESRFFWGSFKSKPSFHALAVLLANYLAEKWAVKHSDRVICLNRRDSDVLMRIYGRGATDIIPMSIMDRGALSANRQHEPRTEDFGIFVGGAFYANVSGMQWFARHVAHRLPCKIVVVGQGFEQHASFFEQYPNIKVVGSVADVGEWYRRASFAIAPIFDGSGMKTKVAEALMYGLPVVGTCEAFVGYDDVVLDAGLVCNNEEEFVTGISKIYSGQLKFDPIELRNFYDSFYSFNAAKNNLAAVFGRLLT
jgi:polysaccharide biosynthesis protein PslH